MQDFKQIITKLTPLADVFTTLKEFAEPVAARDIAVADALGKVLAADINATPRPAQAIALTDGWAVSTADIADATSYATVTLDKNAIYLETCDEMPPGTETVCVVSIWLTSGSILRLMRPRLSTVGVKARPTPYFL